MKHLKSSLRDLRTIFERSITVRELAEPLVSFDETHESEEVREFMQARGFDVVGVRRNGLIAGFVNSQELEDGPLDPYVQMFNEKTLLAENATLLDSFHILRNHGQGFVTVMDQVWGIITRGDLQKTPTRMWFFGLISLIEMQFLRIIREQFPGDAWQANLSGNRLEAAKRIYDERQQRNEDIELVDCLQFKDKGRVIEKNEILRDQLGFSSRQQMRDAMEELRRLRDDLSHAHDIIAGRWPDLVDLADKAEEILRRAESIVE